MPAKKPLRLLFCCLLALAGALPARAQLADRELAAPRVTTDEPAQADFDADTLSAEQRRDQTLRVLAIRLQLQPHQTLALRRALTTDLAPAGLVEPARRDDVVLEPREELRLLLTESQLARLQQWQAREPAGRQLSFIALSQ